MRLIECYTDSHVDNLSACLRLKPRELVMVGCGEAMAGTVQRYRRLLRGRGLDTRVTLCDVGGLPFAQLCPVLGKLVCRDEECVIDLTGGDETVILAVGAVLAKLASEGCSHVRVERQDHDTGFVWDCVTDACLGDAGEVSFSVEELVALHGGSIQPGSWQPPAGVNVRDIQKLWQMVCDSPKAWNKSMMLLSEFESRAESKNQVYLPLGHIRGRISDFDRKERELRELLGQFQKLGVVDDRSTRDCLAYTYRSELMRHCTQKAGNMLEIKTLLEGRDAENAGKPFFGDCRMGVSIDWDGVVNPPRDRIPETRNEIDVVLMHGTTPLFISCKNGNIGEEELYKLHTVATRFGGPHARKMLIATELDRKSVSANRAFIQRAWDMDIFLVTDGAQLAREEWAEVLRQAVK